MMEKLKKLASELGKLQKELQEIDQKLIEKFDQELVSKRGKISEKIEKALYVKKLLDDLKEAERIIVSETDEELIAIAIEEKENIMKKLLEIEKDLEEENAKNSCIIEIRAGVGGEEAALFASDLLRMYMKFAERKGWNLKILSARKSDLGGIKEVSVLIEGRGVYDIFKLEAGVHRVQRVPVTEASGRIHTSTATVAVLEEPGELEIKINPQDLEIETFRASGPGGQHVNKTESAVRVRHIPTGITVVCQEERSQHMNKERAIRLLRAKLYQIEKEKLEKQIEEKRKEQIGSAERSEKTRTYNFMQNRVTDHVLGVTVYRLEEVLDGNLELIYQEYREKQAQNISQSD
ncbi:MAG: PCRF domain-containing protein [Candidatus Calescibacterium sp.]|nr:PCRF domain-containing protein [Candidatus Calescibacterium sp.]